MTWKKYPRHDFMHEAIQQRQQQMSVNRMCFIRKQHECGKALGASKSCFIACPNTDDISPMLELLSEKLTKHGFDPVIAVRERAYGQDIFCTKICGKIIEARFCAVILDDVILENSNIPNPNVYYEYGLMTSLRKHIIPLQKDGQKLAFNIQSYDTIKYTPKNLAAELERAIRDAIRITTEGKDSQEQHPFREKIIYRKLEVSGFIPQDPYKWHLTDVIEDTSFIGFSNDKDPSILFLGKIDDENDTQTYLEDLDVIVTRTERIFEKLSSHIADIEKKYNAIKGEKHGYLGYDLEQEIKQLPKNKIKLQAMEKIYIGFIISIDKVNETFFQNVRDALQPFKRYIPVFSEKNLIQIGGTTVEFTR